MKITLWLLTLFVPFQGLSSTIELKGSLQRMLFVDKIETCSQEFKFDKDACAYGVRTLTECAERPTGWCNASAAQYKVCPYSCEVRFSKSCNSDYHANWVESTPLKSSDCMSPGDIRIYKGPCHNYRYHKGFNPSQEVISNSHKMCRKILLRQGFVTEDPVKVATFTTHEQKIQNEIMLGDFHGHIEIVGKAAKEFHHFETSFQPIDHPEQLGHRRQLVSCLQPRKIN